MKVDGNASIGTTTAVNRLDVEGAAAIGATYSGSSTAPSNGLLVEGAVRIGTTASPDKAKVVVNGKVGNTSAIFGVSTTGVSLINNWPAVMFNSYWATYPTALSDGYAGSLWYGPSDGHFEWRTGTNPGAGNTVTETVRMVILNGGNVGVGVSSPTNRLHVSPGAVAADSLMLKIVGTGAYGKVKATTDGFGFNENIVVDGDVVADAIVINDWTIEAPDYVFEPGYKLCPLAEVERYVQATKHLPEMPSGVDLKKGGVDLADLNMALLKKVEELTLYAIAQDKRIAVLESVLRTQGAGGIVPAAQERE